MKQTNINISVPKWVDDFFAEEGRKRFLTKGAVVRLLLVSHVRQKEPGRDPAYEPVVAGAAK